MKLSDKKLSSVDPAVIAEGIQEIDATIDTLTEKDIPLIIDALTSLFYIDTFDRPDLRKVVESAQQTVAKIGPRALKYLLEKVRYTDIKAELALARTCGLIGKSAIAPLIEILRTSSDTTDVAFILYALGKIKTPEIIEALPDILYCVKSPVQETEDTAVRALGKICESINPADLNDDQKQEIINLLMDRSRHDNEVIRAKAVRGLGKLIQYGFVTDAEKEVIITRVRATLGLVRKSDWDTAYLVRRESQQILDQTQ